MELLVVIAIIGVLAAILLPTLARGKTHAQRSVCMNNLKQWALAMKLYTQEDEDKDFLPRESAYTPGTSVNSWFQVHDPIASDVWYNTLPPFLTASTASNYFYMKAAFYDRSCLFQCPSAKITPNNLYALFSVSMNSKLIKAGLPLSVTDLCYPANTVMFLDNLLDGEEALVPGVPKLGQPSSSANRFSARHGQRGNMVFWDGHTDSFTARQVVDTTPGPSYGSAIEPQRNIVWDPCP
jgi:prepilin-type processing-associated H-X9-DG protein